MLLFLWATLYIGGSGSGGQKKKFGGGENKPNPHKKGGNNKPKHNFPCHHCKEKGHFSRECPKKKGGNGGGENANLCGDSPKETTTKETMFFDAEIALFGAEGNAEACMVDFNAESCAADLDTESSNVYIDLDTESYAADSDAEPCVFDYFNTESCAAHLDTESSILYPDLDAESYVADSDAESCVVDFDAESYAADIDTEPWIVDLDTDAESYAADLVAELRAADIVAESRFADIVAELHAADLVAESCADLVAESRADLVAESHAADLEAKLRAVDLEESPETALIASDDIPCDEKWWLDSGCSRHMTGVKEDLWNYHEFTQKNDPRHQVTLADKSVVPGEGEGDLCMYLKDEKDENVAVKFKEVMYVPKLKKRLISIGQLVLNNTAEVTFRDQTVTLSTGGRKFVFGNRFGKLYELSYELVLPASCNLAIDDKSISLWHLRFGHLNINDVKKLSSEEMVEGMPVVKSKPMNVDCEGCALGKQARYPFQKNPRGKRTSEVLERVHSDVCGPMNIASVGGSSYYVTFIDDYSNYVWVHLLKQKSEVFAKFKEFLAVAQNLTDRRLKRFRFDNGGEYISTDFNNFLKQQGIYKEPTIPYTPQQNGVAERMNRTIMDNVRSLLHHGKLPLSLWGEAVSTVVYLRNRSPTSGLKEVTPFEKLFGVKPDVGHLRVFGCDVFAKVPDEKRRKLDPKAVKGIFVGYPEGSKGYKIFLPKTRKMIRSRDVKFLEQTFSSDGQLDQPSELIDLGARDHPVHEMIADVVGFEFDESDEEVIGDDQIVEDVDDFEDDLQPPPVARPRRIRREPDRYGEWVAIADTENEETDPKTYKQALRSPSCERWKEAMLEEFSSLVMHQTWDLVDLPKGRNIVGCKWVFKTKRDASGEIDRFKARLVAQGYSQEHGIDYDEVFAPVAKYKSIRSVLAIANQYNLEIHQMDVKSAFLNGKLEEEIFMKQPEGFVDEKNPNKVCRLNSSLYGLKQSARCWNQVIDAHLKSIGYKASEADPCVYFKVETVNGTKIITILAVYTDDTIICSSSLKHLISEKKNLCARFEMDDRGEIHFILGMSVRRNRELGILTIDQKAYLETVLKRFAMSDCRPVGTAAESAKKFLKIREDEESCDVSKYQCAIGSLNYAAIATRPDISQAVGMLSQFMQSPSEEHWIGIKRILRYLKGTLSFGLKFSRSDSFVLHGYSDSDWASCSESRKSTSGLIFRLGECTVSWRSKKQSIVALSSTEAEYVALCEACQEVTWLRRLLHDIGLPQTSKPTTVYEDNQGAMALSMNPKDHPRTKHIDVRFHYIRDCIDRKRVNLEYVRTTDMVADTLTKALPKPAFEKFRMLMGVMEC